ncbi:MAG: pyridoxal-phosphate dependent enzyme [Arenimonas sp.]
MRLRRQRVGCNRNGHYRGSGNRHQQGGGHQQLLHGGKVSHCELRTMDSGDASSIEVGESERPDMGQAQPRETPIPALTRVKACCPGRAQAVPMQTPAPLLATARGAATDRSWTAAAIAHLRHGVEGSETPMRELRLSAFPDIRFLFKDETVHPSGSLKHRLARALFLHALVSGRLNRGQGVIDASSGSTAISEAWFAHQLGIPFTAVMPRSTTPGKLRDVRQLHGHCALVDPPTDSAQHARRLAEANSGCYLDQFGLAAVATDWRGNNNIAQSILQQCRQSGVDDPTWVVCGAGTGGTSATIGRYLRYAGSQARLCIAEPVGAAFARGWRQHDRAAIASAATVIEGIGRPRVEPCFVFELVDEVLEINDAQSIAACLLLERFSAVRYGGSSGTNLVAALMLARGMQVRGEHGTIVLVLCDRGERYADTLYCDEWLVERGLDPAPALDELARAAGKGSWLTGADCNAMQISASRSPAVPV